MRTFGLSGGCDTNLPIYFESLTAATFISLVSHARNKPSINSNPL